MRQARTTAEFRQEKVLLVQSAIPMKGTG